MNPADADVEHDELVADAGRRVLVDTDTARQSTFPLRAGDADWRLSVACLRRQRAPGSTAMS